MNFERLVSLCEKYDCDINDIFNACKYVLNLKDSGHRPEGLSCQLEAALMQLPVHAVMALIADIYLFLKITALCEDHSSFVSAPDCDCDCDYDCDCDCEEEACEFEDEGFPFDVCNEFEKETETSDEKTPCRQSATENLNEETDGAKSGKKPVRRIVIKLR